MTNPTPFYLRGSELKKVELLSTLHGLLTEKPILVRSHLRNMRGSKKVSRPNIQTLLQNRISSYCWTALCKFRLSASGIGTDEWDKLKEHICPPVPQGVCEQCRRDLLQEIDKNIKEYEIPTELVVNSDQTPSSYMSVGKSTMAPRGSKAIYIKGITDKRAITLTFVVTMSNDLLTMQVVYSGKTKKLVNLVISSLLQDCASFTIHSIGPMKKKP